MEDGKIMIGNDKKEQTTIREHSQTISLKWRYFKDENSIFQISL